MVSYGPANDLQIITADSKSEAESAIQTLIGQGVAVSEIGVYEQVPVEIETRIRL